LQPKIIGKKMKNKLLIAISFFTPMTFFSCISEEALNSEADITSCQVDKSILIRDPVISNDKVTLYVKDSTDIRMLLSTWHDVISASLLRASSEIQEKKVIGVKKLMAINNLFFIFLPIILACKCNISSVKIKIN
jgi:hypothetical protein